MLCFINVEISLPFFVNHDAFFQFSFMNKKSRMLFDIDIFCSIINVVAVAFGQFNDQINAK